MHMSSIFKGAAHLSHDIPASLHSKGTVGNDYSLMSVLNTKLGVTKKRLWSMVLCCSVALIKVFILTAAYGFSICSVHDCVVWHLVLDLLDLDIV